ncbi:MAG: hypothetical protein M0036_24975 [Desulfobacteraceae bacterium]|nr:hypothetical protein [Desulfobacteraceae bacterium]
METNISNNLSSSTPYMGQDLRSLQAERAAVAAVSTSKSMDVQLVTAEGDKVTISLDAKAASMYGVFESAGMQTDKDSAQVGYQKTQIGASSYEREMTFTVEGDLNDQEKKDIQKALKTLNRMMKGLVHGDFKSMLGKAEKLKGLESITSIDAQMSYARTVVVAQQAAVSAQTGSAPAITKPADQNAQVTATQPSSPVLELAQKADQVADTTAKEVQKTQTPMERIMAFFDKMLDDYRQQAAQLDPNGAKLVDRVAQQLRAALEQFNKQSQ